MLVVIDIAGARLKIGLRLTQSKIHGTEYDIAGFDISNSSWSKMMTT